MNILFISYGLYPCKIGGVEIFNYYLIKSLNRKGHQTFVITTCGQADSNSIIYSFNPKKLLSQKVSAILITLFFIVKLRKKIDVIHAPFMGNSWLMGFFLPICAKLFQIPYVLSIHGGGMHKWGPSFIRASLFRYASTLIGVSVAIQKEYGKRYGRVIKVIPPLIPFLESEISKNEIRKKYGFEEDNIIVLSLGSIKKIKGSDILLDSFLKLGKDYINKKKVKLLYVGEGEMEGKLRRRIDENRFESHVIFLGNVPYEKVPEMYKLSDIYVIPSLFEGTPKSLLEAMFNGLPVIGSNTTGINNIIYDRENGYLFNLEDSEDLKEKIKFVIENLNQKEIGLKAKELVSNKYQYEETVKEFVEVYQNTIRNIHVFSGH